MEMPSKGDNANMHYSAKHFAREVLLKLETLPVLLSTSSKQITMHSAIGKSYLI